MPIRSSILVIPVLAALFFASFPARADEIKDISQLVSQGQHAQALDKLNGYLTAHPNEVQGQFLKGVVLAETGKTAEASRLFTDITINHPELPEPYNNLAVIYAEQGQYDQARRALELAIKTHPSYATAHENLGDVYARMATDAYDKALQRDKNNTRTEIKLAMVKQLFSAGAPRPAQAVAKAHAPPTKAVVVPALHPPAAVATRPAAPHVAPAPPLAVAKLEPVRPPATESAKAPKENPAQDDQKKAVEDTVRDWARAWSARNVEGYLAYYGAGFKVPNGESRGAWEKSRRMRIDAPASIKVELSGIRIKMEDDNRASVSFRQSYRAGDIAKRTAKTLVMKKGGSKWFIEQELTDR